MHAALTQLVTAVPRIPQGGFLDDSIRRHSVTV